MILAAEVGISKTIEARLIIKELRAGATSSIGSLSSVLQASCKKRFTPGLIEAEGTLTGQTRLAASIVINTEHMGVSSHREEKRSSTTFAGRRLRGDATSVPSSDRTLPSA